MDKNMVLLTQGEIDTLVGFLREKKEAVTDEVLSQGSIDKLIRLIENRSETKISFDRLLSHVSNEQCLKTAGLREKEDEVCELRMKVDEKTKFVVLTAVNLSTKKEVSITPDGFCKQDFSIEESEWGYSIMPAYFDEIAMVYGLKYTEETYQSVCELYKEKNYGTGKMELSAAFLPSQDMVERLLEKEEA